MKSTRRKVEILVISDIHLGTYGSKAQELLKYLHTVDPEILILNGDIIDIWQFSKRYFPKSHLKVIKYLTGLLTKGTRIFYVTGNHDEMLRRFVGFELGEFKIVNTLLLELDGKKTWIFHGDVFDITMKHSMWLAKLGAIGYDALIHLNTFMNWISRKMGKGRISLSKKIKASVKGALKYINDFETMSVYPAQIRNIPIIKRFPYEEKPPHWQLNFHRAQTHQNWRLFQTVNPSDPYQPETIGNF